MTAPGSLRSRERGSTLTTVLAIIGGIVLAAIVISVIVVWFVTRHVRVDVRESAAGKQVSIETPFGGIQVREAEEVARELNLPVYPGAWSADRSVSVQLWGDTGEEGGQMDIVVAEFRTDDPLDRVDAWYRERLGKEFRRETGRLVGTTGDRRPRRPRVRPGDGVAFLEERGDRHRGVGLEPRRGGTKIVLFDIWQGSEL